MVYPMIKNRIKEYRARFDMKQEELAAKVGVRRETIETFEKENTIHHCFGMEYRKDIPCVTIEEIFTVEE